MNRAIMFAIAFVLTLAACAGGSASRRSGDPNPAPANKFAPFQRLIPILNGDPAKALEQIEHGKPKALMADKLSGQEGWISHECGADEPKSDSSVNLGALFAAILGPLVKSGINLGLASLEKKLKAEIEEYSAKYSATAWLDSEESREVTCFRFIRGKANNAGEEVLLDLVFKLIRDSETNAVGVRPLRIFFSEPAPKNKSTDGSYGFAASLTTTRVDNKDHKKVSEIVLLKDKFKLTDKAEWQIHYFSTASGRFCTNDRRDAHPLICSDVNPVAYVSISSAETGKGPANGVTVTAVETGTPSKSLKTFAKIFEGAKKDIGEGLGDIAEDKLDIED